jgi:hypothetical protein
VHREDLVVDIRGKNVAVGTRQLHPDQQRFDATDEEERERGEPVQDPDPLVVDGRDPAPEPRGRGRTAEPSPTLRHRCGRHISSFLVYSSVCK